ncbi:hypothetical protein [Microbacterium aurantiacum]|uniref:DUF4386 family protein n=1 Tax=Microbacterium aurantiacum TaxID=162393 RepID=A0ABT8FT32_9MICO|nr:hypothetical protein [Microbacterium aurantiacum]MDN4464477.1 hypothetical protein [Microbacterium aurantiacum]
MSTTSDPAGSLATRSHSTTSAHGLRRRAWPLWASAAGILGLVGTVVLDARPPAETEAWLTGEDYLVTAADVLTVDPLLNRLGWTAGLLAVAALLVFQAVWRRAVDDRFPSAAGKVVSASVIATAAAGLLGYGWKGALGNYLGPEVGMYDESGLFVYYILTDFGAYFPWFAMVVAAFAVAWMAFRERLVSRILGGVSVVFALGLTALTFGTGVPGLPATLMPLWLTILGVWLAVGRSRITWPETAR